MASTSPVGGAPSSMLSEIPVSAQSTPAWPGCTSVSSSTRPLETSTSATSVSRTERSLDVGPAVSTSSASSRTRVRPGTSADAFAEDAPGASPPAAVLCSSNTARSSANAAHGGGRFPGGRAERNGAALVAEGGGAGRFPGGGADRDGAALAAEGGGAAEGGAAGCTSAAGAAAVALLGALPERACCCGDSSVRSVASCTRCSLSVTLSASPDAAPSIQAGAPRAGTPWRAISEQWRMSAATIWPRGLRKAIQTQPGSRRH
mmetsp:Transcript_38550/g.114502  ORF Transcript_38550/g.114502 Transcript_38550/m.114502 type:complete len:261 (-) Transcript_38550:88-870(-)